MSSALNVEIGFAVLAGDDCAVKDYRLGADSDRALYLVVKDCLSRREDLCANRGKYSISPLHTKAIEELCHADR